jgi:hypothetical protein
MAKKKTATKKSKKKAKKKVVKKTAAQKKVKNKAGANKTKTTFIRACEERWQHCENLSGPWNSATEFLSAAVSGGRGTEAIAEWFETNELQCGSDWSCEAAIESAYLVGAWDVSAQTLHESLRSGIGDPDAMAAKAVQKIVEVAAAGKPFTEDGF